MANRNFYLTLILLFFGTLQLCLAQENFNSNKSENIDTLFLRLNYEEFDDNQILNYLQTAKSVQNIGIKEQMKTFLEKIRIKIDLEKDNRISFMYFLLEARNLLFYHNYSQAIIEAENAMNRLDYSEKDELIYNYSTIASCYYYQSDYVKALESHQKALKICETNSDIDCFAGIYNNLSVVYMGTQDWEKAEEYTLKAIEDAEQNDDNFEKSRAIGNMAIVFAEKGEFKKAEDWFIKDLEFDLIREDRISASRNYNNLGRLNDMQGQFIDALEYYLKGLELAKLENDAASVALGYQNLGWIQHKLGRNTEGLINIKKGMQMTKKLGNRDNLRDAYLNISEFYQALNRPKDALDYFVLYHDLNDSLIGENHLSAISELEIKYETEKKENEILKLSDEQLKSEATILTQNRKVRQLSIGLVTLCLIAILTFLLFKQRLQNKKQNELLLAISETQSAERKRISQDLHDSIGGALALTKSKLQSALTKIKETPSEMEEAILALNNTSDQVRQISHNLMPGELVRFGLVSAINTLLEQLNNEELHAQLYANQMEDRIEPLKEIQLYRIVQEAIQNVLKHARAKNLYVHLNKHKKHLSLLIEDDGIGIITNNREGLGFKNIEQRIKLLNGTFSLDSSENKGTTLNIQIPI